MNTYLKTKAEKGTTISDRAFNLIMGMVLLYGFALNWYMVVTIPVESLQAIPMWGFLIGYFVSCLIGIALFQSSDNPVVSFIGYNLIVVPIGLVLNLVLVQYYTDLIIAAMQVTTMVTFGMIVLGTLFPSFFIGLGRILFFALLLAIVAELIMMFVFNMNLTVMDWIVAVIFCGYIGFDWAKAQEGPKTVDKAVDGAAALYLDIINLFLRILEIMSKK